MMENEKVPPNENDMDTNQETGPSPNIEMAPPPNASNQDISQCGQGDSLQCSKEDSLKSNQEDSLKTNPEDPLQCDKEDLLNCSQEDTLKINPEDPLQCGLDVPLQCKQEYSLTLQCSLEGRQEKLWSVLYCQWLEESPCCDLQLCTLDGIIHVHTCVMMAFCPVIAEIIAVREAKMRKGKTPPGQCPIDIQFEFNTVKLIVNAIYSGDFHVTDDIDLYELYDALLWFDMEELRSIITTLEESIDVEVLNEKRKKRKLSRKKKNLKSVKRSTKSKKKERVMVMKLLSEKNVDADGVYTLSKKKKKRGPKMARAVIKRAGKKKNPKGVKSKKVLIRIGGDEVDLNSVKTEVLDEDVGYMFVDADGKSYIKCEKCKETFTDVNEYQTHVSNHKTFPCDKCSRVFYNQSSLCRHRRNSHLKSDHLKCWLCEFVAKEPTQFSEHCQSAHQITEAFRCQEDGCTFKTSAYRYLSRHFETHETFRSAVCKKCGQNFRTRGCLHSHKRSCYGVQSYLCDVCGQSFNHPTSMKTHRRAMHFGEKPHKCKVCGKSFSEKSNLKRHLRIHSNAYPYSCPVCAQPFRHSNTLKSHLNKHGGADNFDIAACKNPNADPKADISSMCSFEPSNFPMNASDATMGLDNNNTASMNFSSRQESNNMKHQNAVDEFKGNNYRQYGQNFNDKNEGMQKGPVPFTTSDKSLADQLPVFPTNSHSLHSHSQSPLMNQNIPSSTAQYDSAVDFSVPQTQAHARQSHPPPAHDLSSNMAVNHLMPSSFSRSLHLALSNPLMAPYMNMNMNSPATSSASSSFPVETSQSQDNAVHNPWPYAHYDPRLPWNNSREFS